MIGVKFEGLFKSSERREIGVKEIVSERYPLQHLCKPFDESKVVWARIAVIEVRLQVVSEWLINANVTHDN